MVGMKLRLRKIVSGGQTGADQGGLRAGKALGLKTGGWVPAECQTLDGRNYNLKVIYGCQEHISSRYSKRTFANVRDSDGTVRFAADWKSPGEVCTWKAVLKFGRPCFDIDVFKPYYPESFIDWLKMYRIRCLNVAGHSERTHPGMSNFVYWYLIAALRTELEKR